MASYWRTPSFRASRRCRLEIEAEGNERTVVYCTVLACGEMRLPIRHGVLLGMDYTSYGTHWLYFLGCWAFKGRAQAE